MRQLSKPLRMRFPQAQFLKKKWIVENEKGEYLLVTPLFLFRYSELILHKEVGVPPSITRGGSVFYSPCVSDTCVNRS